MQGVVWAYDLSALVILVICSVYYFRTLSSRASGFNVFLQILLVSFIGGISDIFSIFLGNSSYFGEPIWYLLKQLYYLCVGFIPPLYLLYIVGTTDTWHLIRNKKFRVAEVLTPVVVCCVVNLAGIFWPIVVEANIDGTISYRWGYILSNILIFLYMFGIIRYLEFLGKYIGNKPKRIMIVPIIILICSLIIRWVFPGQRIVIFGIVASCLLLVLINRSAEDSLDITTGMYSYKMFARNMEMKMNTKKEMEIILVNIFNFEHAIRIVGYDEVMEMMKPLSSEIIRIMKDYKHSYICYYNGDGKFAIELSKGHFKNVNEIANDIIKAINQNLKLEVSDFEIRISACIVKCPQDVSDVESLFMLITDFDNFPSENKVLYSDEITGTEDFRVKREMTTILDRALANNYFSVFYQPIYDVKQKKFKSAEALIRLRDPKFGYISPGVFIPLAEKSGAIHEIGSFVIEEVCKFIASDDFKNLGVDYIEINLSVMQCLRADLADEIIDVAKKYKINPKQLNLEITETASAYSKEKLHGNIRELNNAGFEFSLDDFGTGYSNLMRIASLPLSIVKLDRTFVLLEEKSGYHKIIKNLIVMLRDMGLHVLVEGVETEEMATTFAEMGVQYIQGFYFSRPLTKTDYIAFNKKHNFTD